MDSRQSGLQLRPRIRILRVGRSPRLSYLGNLGIIDFENIHLKFPKDIVVLKVGMYITSYFFIDNFLNEYS